MGRKVIEICAEGIDESYQGISSTPFGNLGPGLRVPAAVSGSAERYLFCLATISVTSPARIIGIRQGLTIGVATGGPLAETPSPERPIEMAVKTPTFHFGNGNVSWHLVNEPVLGQTPAATDASNWTYQQSVGPALLYNTFTNSNVDAAGRPLNYAVGLTAYTAPQTYRAWKGLGGLMTMRELRFPWDNGNAWGCLDIPFTGRAVLYASILQADPTASSYLTGNAYPTTIDQSGSTPEESFIAAQYTAAAGATPATGPSYWRVLGSMIVEVED